MDEDKVVLCGANAYVEKFYFNEKFEMIPGQIQEELKKMCVLYTNEIGGVLTLSFNEEGEMEFETSHEEDDFLYDEIGSVLRIKALQKEHVDLVEALEMFYKISFLGLSADELM